MRVVTLEKRLDLRVRPDKTTIMHQDWRNLLFLHWMYDPEEIQKSLPEGLFVDTFEGKGYLTLTPLFMQNLFIPPLPPIIGLSKFIEINARTYVFDQNGVPGIWFYSLDINSHIASFAAKMTFSLPYFSAHLKKRSDYSMEGNRIEPPPAFMLFDYHPLEKTSYFAEPGSLDFFLIERYCLFTLSKKNLYMGQIHHHPYPLQQVTVKQAETDLLTKKFPALVNRPFDMAHFSIGVDVDIFPLTKIN